MLLSGFAYKYKCGGCSATYYGNTKCHFIVQIVERLDVSHLTGKKVKIGNTNPRIPLILQLRSMLHSNFSILIRKCNEFKLETMQNRLITPDNPSLKEEDSWLPLGLFWCNISGYHMIFCTLFDSHLSHYRCTSAVCSVFNILLRILVFDQKQDVLAFNIIVGVTMKT